MIACQHCFSKTPLMSFALCAMDHSPRSAPSFVAVMSSPRPAYTWSRMRCRFVMRYVSSTIMRSATATNVEHAVNRRVLPIELPIVWTVRIHQALLRGHLIGARLATPSPQCLRQRLLD
jgi:hypothetical protein